VTPDEPRQEEESTAGADAPAVADDAGEDAPGLEVMLDFLHRELLVRARNPRMEESLATGKEGEQVLDCTARRGKSLRCRVTITPMKADPSRGVTLVVGEAAP
jgi:hypothetical protein